MYSYKQYYDDRIKRAKERYGNKAKDYKCCYHVLSLFSAICTAIIPVAAYLDSSKSLIVILGILNAIFISCLSIFKCNEKWVLYRTTVGNVKHQNYLYLAKAEDYAEVNEEARLAILVSRVESILNEKNSSWAEFVKPVETNTK